jgi:hypothetical protein
LPLRPVVWRPAALVTSNSDMKPMKLAEVYRAIALPPGVSADGRFLPQPSGVRALLVAAAPQAAFVPPSSSERASYVAGRQAPREEE